MSVKKKKKTQISNVQRVEKTDNAGVKEPEPQAPVPEAAVQKQEVPAPAAAEKPIVVSQPLKNILARINGLKPNELALINQFGLPIKDFAEWMFMMEQTLRQVPSVTEKGIAEELVKRSMEERQKQAASSPAASSGNAGGGGGGMGQIFNILDKVMGSSSSNPLMDKYVEALITRNMNEMVESTTFDKIMREYFVKKMSKELGEPLLGPAAKPAGA